MDTNGYLWIINHVSKVFYIFITYCTIIYKKKTIPVQIHEITRNIHIPNTFTKKKVHGIIKLYLFRIDEVEKR